MKLIVCLLPLLLCSAESLATSGPQKPDLAQEDIKEIEFLLNKIDVRFHHIARVIFTNSMSRSLFLQSQDFERSKAQKGSFCSAFSREEYKTPVIHQIEYIYWPPIDLKKRGPSTPYYPYPWSAAYPSLELKLEEARFWLGEYSSHPGMKQYKPDPLKALQILRYLRQRDLDGFLADDTIVDQVEDILGKLKSAYRVYMWAGLLRGIEDEATLSRFITNNSVKNGLYPLRPELRDLLITLVGLRQSYLGEQLPAITQHNEVFVREVLESIRLGNKEFGLAEPREDLLVLDKNTGEFFPLEAVLYQKRQSIDAEEITPGP